VEHLEGKGGDSVVAISGFLCGSSNLCCGYFGVSMW
jgi:hypothetical protein